MAEIAPAESVSLMPNSGLTNANVQQIAPVERLVPGLRSLYVKRSGWLRESFGSHYVKINREYNLHFVLSGRGRVLVDGQAHEMGAGDAFMFFPGHRAEYHDFPGERWEYYWVALGAPEGMAQTLASAVAAAGLTEASPRLSLPAHSALWSFIPKLHNCLWEGSYGGFFPVSAAWRIFDGLGAEPSVGELSLAERVRSYVDSLEGMAEVMELAVRFGVSRSTLHRIFSTAFGVSLKDYMQVRRFGRVCELLAETGLDIQQVAAATGFSSVQYFCRAFNSQFGLSPGAWRRLHPGRRA